MSGVFFSCCSHLSLYGHFHSESDKISEESFKPVWSGRSKRKHNIFRHVTHTLLLSALCASDLMMQTDSLFVALQMKQELVEPQLTVRRVGGHLSCFAVC